MKHTENPNEFYEQSDDRKGLIGALTLHSLLVIALIVSLLASPEAPTGPIQMELWTEGTEQVVKAPAQTQSPEPAEEDTTTDEDVEPPAEEPEPQESVADPKEAAPAPEPPPAPQQAAAQAQQQEDPEIAIENETPAGTGRTTTESLGRCQSSQRGP